MIPIDAHTMMHDKLIGHRDVQSAVGAIFNPNHLIKALHCCYCYQNVLQNSIPVDI